MWFKEGQRANIMKKYIPKRLDVSSNNITYSTLNSESNREDICVYLKNQQTHNFHNHNYKRRGPILT